jgi:hypothetical protein
VRTAWLRYAQGPKSYIASAPQVSGSALRAAPHYIPAACDKKCFRPAAQSCRAPCPKEGALRGRQCTQHHCFPVHPGQWHQLVGKAPVRHAKPPRHGSLSHRAGQLLGAVVVRARYGHPLRFYITPHCPQCPAAIPLKLHLVSVTAARPSGEGNRRYAKWPSLERSSVVGAFRSLRVLRAAVCRPIGVLALWHLSGVLRIVLVSGSAVHLVFAPAHPWGLLASQHRPRGLPVRPPWGLPQNRVLSRQQSRYRTVLECLFVLSHIRLWSPHKVLGSIGATTIVTRGRAELVV